jgi:hypothetical protein
MDRRNLDRLEIAPGLAGLQDEVPALVQPELAKPLLQSFRPQLPVPAVMDDPHARDSPWSLLPPRRAA